MLGILPIITDAEAYQRNYAEVWLRLVQPEVRKYSSNRGVCQTIFRIQSTLETWIDYEECGI